MRFLSIFKTAERGTPCSEQEMAVMGKLIEEGMKAAGCSRRKAACPARWAQESGGRATTSTLRTALSRSRKSWLAGFAILKADSKEEAIELARKFLKVAGEGECELRQLYDANCADANGAGSIEREVALKA